MLVTEEDFARAEAAMGQKVHQHDGVWWKQARPGYFKPIHEFRAFAPWSACPDRWKSFIGYSHQVPHSAVGNRNVTHNILQGDDLAQFAIERIPSKKRNQVRQGLRHCRIEDLVDGAETLEMMRRINIVQAERFVFQGKRGGFLSASYYENSADRWRQEMRLRFAHPGQRFIGAFVGEHLAAYAILIEIEDSWFFGAVKSSDRFNKSRPVDALYFYFLTMASRTESCRRVVNGGGDEPESLAHYKAQFLFQREAIPYHTVAPWPLSMLKTLRGPS